MSLDGEFDGAGVDGASNRALFDETALRELADREPVVSASLQDLDARMRTLIARTGAIDHWKADRTFTGSLDSWMALQRNRVAAAKREQDLEASGATQLPYVSGRFDHILKNR